MKIKQREKKEGEESVSESIDEDLLIDPKLLIVGSKTGQGAHGKVYEGRYKDQMVAIKILGCCDTLEERASLENGFAQEINIMSRLQHENVVKFIGACKDPEMLIVTELLSGMSLRKYLISLHPTLLDLQVVINFALNIARGMDYLYANGIIHRDLKPDNLLLTADQKSIKLADFGNARKETVTGLMTADAGTHCWMAPEKERPSLPEYISLDLAFVIRSCWTEDPKVRPSFSQIIILLNAFFPSQEPGNDKDEVAVTKTIAIPQISSQKKGKVSCFWKNLFASRRTKNS